MTNMTDEHLMASFRDMRDLRSFEELTDRYSAKALGVARHYLLDQAAAEDAVQETFIRVMRHADRFAPQAPFGPWFYRMLRNICFDMLRKRKTYVNYMERFGADQSGSQWNGISDDVDNPSTLLSQLPGPEREVLVMKIINDMSFSDIAAAVDSTVEAVKKRSQRGLKRLKAMYQSRANQKEVIASR